MRARHLQATAVLVCSLLVTPLVLACSTSSGKSGASLARADSLDLDSAITLSTPLDSITHSSETAKADIDHTVTRDAGMGVHGVSARGVVRVVGAAPQMVVVLDSGGGEVTLTGPLVAELATLHGAEVAIVGRANPGPRPIGRRGESVNVERYSIESIAGRKPVVGFLHADSAGSWIGSTRIAVAPSEFEKLLGAKIWIVGTANSSGSLEVSTYGVLRPSLR